MPHSPAKVKATTDGNILGDVEAEVPLFLSQIFQHSVDVQANTIGVMEAEKFGDTLGKEIGKAFFITLVEEIELEKVETVGETLKD